MYEPLVGVGGGGELVHLELIGPDMYDRAKTKAFLKFIADNADVISTGMRGANLCFYATNPGKNAKAYFCHEIWVRFDTVESSATPSFEGAMCSTGEAAPGNVIKLTLIFNLPSLLVIPRLHPFHYRTATTVGLDTKTAILGCTHIRLH